MGGWDMLYYSVFRESDMYECVSNFQDSAETLDDMIENLRIRIDKELVCGVPFGDPHFKEAVQ